MSDPNSSLIKSIGSSSLDLLSDTAEVSLDSILNEGLLQDIPVFGSIVKLTKIGLTVRDHLFINKLRVFLKHINSIDSETRQLFLDKHFKDESSSINLGEKLINTIDKIDSNQKAYYSAKAFKLFVLEEISDVEFYDLLYIIENFKLHYSQFYIDTCLTIEESDRSRPEITDHFFVIGLFLEDNEKQFYTYYRDEKRYSNDRITPIREIFLDEILEYDKENLKLKFITKIFGMTRMDFDSKYYEQVKAMSSIEFRNYLNSKTISEFVSMQFKGSFLRLYEDNEWINITKSNDELSFIFHKNTLRQN